MMFRFLLGASALVVGDAVEPNPPVWPETVRVFSPGDGDIQSTVDAAFANNGGTSPEDHGQFSDHRYAFLFKPGQYTETVPVGFYTQVVGLGTSPSDVSFTGAGKGVYCPEGSESVQVGSLDTFWRAAENFHYQADYEWPYMTKGMMWAASQAAPVRRVIVDSDLLLYMYRYPEQAADFASGGFVANSQIQGSMSFGSEQQFFTRNSQTGNTMGAVWNMNYVGVEGAPESHCSNTGGDAVVTIDATPTIAEKPFISISGDKYTLNVPEVKSNSRGVDFSTGRQVDFENVFVADASMNSDTINAKLDEGLDVVLAGGIYHLDKALEVKTNNQVILGLGIPTLIPTNGEPAIKVVGNVDGVRIAGMLLQAGPTASPALLMWGEPGSSYAGTASNPGFIHDVPMRVGGPEISGVQAQSMLQINNGNVIGDNLWLWRADHAAGGKVVGGNNPCPNGAIINGDDVTMYGLMVEHATQDLVQWNGERGRTYFMQSELPYDVTTDYGAQGYVGYRVAETVSDHDAWGVGIYHYFRDFPVVMETAIKVPAQLVSRFNSPLTVFLNGQGVVNHIINELGETTQTTGGNDAVPAWYCGATEASRFVV